MATKRKPRMRARQVIELTPSLKHFLMAGPWRPGDLAPVRLWGWFPTLETIATDDGLRNAWSEHGEALIAEAQAHGFVPAAVVWFDVGPAPSYTDRVDVYLNRDGPVRGFAVVWCRPRRCSCRRQNLRSALASTSRPGQLIAGFEVSINCRFWVSTEALPLGRACNLGAEGTERFAIDAFEDSIARGGQTIQRHHDGVPIPGDVELFIDNRRLLFRLRVHDTPLGRSAISQVRNGTLTGASVKFRQVRGSGGRINEIAEADLREISLTDRPAWFGTAVWLE